MRAEEILKLELTKDERGALYRVLGKIKTVDFNQVYGLNDLGIRIIEEFIDVIFITEDEDEI